MAPLYHGRATRHPFVIVSAVFSKGSTFAKVISKESWVRFVDEFFDGDHRISDADENVLRNIPRTNANDFAAAMARARGYGNPEYEIRMLRDLKRRFVTRFGTDAVAVRGR